jgi:hypothetical protein
MLMIRSSNSEQDMAEDLTCGRPGVLVAAVLNVQQKEEGRGLVPMPMSSSCGLPQDQMSPQPSFPQQNDVQALCVRA